MKRHIEYVHENKQPTIPCSLCDKKVFTTTYLKRHIEQVHEDKQNFQCQDCDKYFQNKQNYEGHRKSIHTKNLVDVFECETCSKTFKLKTRLKAHILRKHQLRKAECDICGKMMESTSLLEHMERMHSTDTFKCNICSKNCKTNQDLRNHIKSAH